MSKLMENILEDESISVEIRQICGEVFGKYISEQKFGIMYKEIEEQVEKDLQNSVPILRNKELNIKNYCKKTHAIIQGDSLVSLNVVNTVVGNINNVYIDSIGIINKIEHNSSKYGDVDWLDFVMKRIKNVYEMLGKDGVIYVHTKEQTVAYLVLELNKVFGKNNYIENFIYYNNDAKEYENILCYAKNKEFVAAKTTNFKVPKPGFDEIMNIRENFILNEKHLFEKPHLELQKRIREYYLKHKSLKGIKQYKLVDTNCNIYRLSDISAPGRSGNDFSIEHPVTQKKCKEPSGGWRYTKDKLLELIISDKVHFGTDETTVPQYKRYLSTVSKEVVSSILPNMNKKNLIKYLLRLVDSKDSKKMGLFCEDLDFLAATTEANLSDDGGRHAIMITHNAEDSLELCSLISEKSNEILQKYVRFYTASLLKNEPSLLERQDKVVRNSIDSICFAENCFEVHEQRTLPGFNKIDFVSYKNADSTKLTCIILTDCFIESSLNSYIEQLSYYNINEIVFYSSVDMRVKSKYKNIKFKKIPYIKF